jgi:hypothetical protein
MRIPVDASTVSGGANQPDPLVVAEPGEHGAILGDPFQDIDGKGNVTGSIKTHTA